jgi:hypothetical protein
MTTDFKTAKPIYCKDCSSRDTFEKFESMNILSESGKIIEQCFKCRRCGKLTWWHNDKSS